MIGEINSRSSDPTACFTFVSLVLGHVVVTAWWAPRGSLLRHRSTALIARGLQKPQEPLMCDLFSFY